jgi:hypothetical protein
MTDWWQAIEAALDARSEQAPDPWSDLVEEDVELTDDQYRFLQSLADQPAVGRLTDEDIDALDALEE